MQQGLFGHLNQLLSQEGQFRLTTGTYDLFFVEVNRGKAKPIYQIESASGQRHTLYHPKQVKSLIRNNLESRSIDSSAVQVSVQ